MSYSILIVVSNEAQRQQVIALLEKQYQIHALADSNEAKSLLSQRQFDLIVAAEEARNETEFSFLKWVRLHAEDIPIFILIPAASVDKVVKAIKMGAEECFASPLSETIKLKRAIDNLMRQRALRDQQQINLAETEMVFPSNIIAHSRSMREVIRLAAKVAKMPTTVMITGESGVGKEIIARHIHRHSERCENAFVAVNCAALTGTLMASELFGHEKGAFTGAVATKRGRFELAHNGTIFLDEIGEMTAELQAILLRALQEQQFERVGGTRTISVDVRVIAATNRDLHKAMQEKQFRDDLYYRLNVFSIHLPPLRERTEDIIPLAEFFVRKISLNLGRPKRGLQDTAKTRLQAYSWPGNVRELQNVIERAVIISKSDELRVDDLSVPFQSTAQIQPIALSISLADIEKQAILTALQQQQGNRAKTADVLGISLRTLQSRLKDYGVTGS